MTWYDLILSPSDYCVCFFLCSSGNTHIVPQLPTRGLAPVVVDLSDDPEVLPERTPTASLTKKTSTSGVDSRLVEKNGVNQRTSTDAAPYMSVDTLDTQHESNTSPANSAIPSTLSKSPTTRKRSAAVSEQDSDVVCILDSDDDEECGDAGDEDTTSKDRGGSSHIPGALQNPTAAGKHLEQCDTGPSAVKHSDVQCIDSEVSVAPDGNTINNSITLDENTHDTFTIAENNKDSGSRPVQNQTPGKADVGSTRIGSNSCENDDNDCGGLDDDDVLFIVDSSDNDENGSESTDIPRCVIADRNQNVQSNENCDTLKTTSDTTEYCENGQCNMKKASHCNTSVAHGNQKEQLHESCATSKMTSNVKEQLENGECNSKKAGVSDTNVAQGNPNEQISDCDTSKTAGNNVEQSKNTDCNSMIAGISNTSVTQGNCKEQLLEKYSTSTTTSNQVVQYEISDNNSKSAGVAHGNENKQVRKKFATATSANSYNVFNLPSPKTPGKTSNSCSEERCPPQYTASGHSGHHNPKTLKPSTSQTQVDHNNFSVQHQPFKLITSVSQDEIQPFILRTQVVDSSMASHSGNQQQRGLVAACTTGTSNAISGNIHKDGQDENARKKVVARKISVNKEGDSIQNIRNEGTLEIISITTEGPDNEAEVVGIKGTPSPLHSDNNGKVTATPNERGDTFRNDSDEINIGDSTADSSSDFNTSNSAAQNYGDFNTDDSTAQCYEDFSTTGYSTVYNGKNADIAGSGDDSSDVDNDGTSMENSIEGDASSPDMYLYLDDAAAIPEQQQTTRDSSCLSPLPQQQNIDSKHLDNFFASMKKRLTSPLIKASRKGLAKPVKHSGTNIYTKKAGKTASSLCPFCFNIRTNMSSHIKAYHRKEKRVIAAMHMVNSQRLQAFAEFKREGMQMEKEMKLAGGQACLGEPTSSFTDPISDDAEAELPSNQLASRNAYITQHQFILYKKLSLQVCPFCKLPRSNLAMHIQHMHIDEKRVLEALSLTNKRERNQAFCDFMKEGFYIAYAQYLSQSSNTADTMQDPEGAKDDDNRKEGSSTARKDYEENLISHSSASQPKSAKAITSAQDDFWIISGSSSNSQPDSNPTNSQDYQWVKRIHSQITESVNTARLGNNKFQYHQSNTSYEDMQFTNTANPGGSQLQLDQSKKNSHTLESSNNADPGENQSSQTGSMPSSLSAMEDLITCPFCLLRIEKGNLQLHILKEHARMVGKLVNQRETADEPPFMCEVCNESFSSHSARFIHVSVCHSWWSKSAGGAFRYKCLICKSQFKTSSALCRHKTQEHGHHLCYCLECKLGFGDSAALTQHNIEKHQSVPSFSCAVCKELVASTSQDVVICPHRTEQPHHKPVRNIAETQNRPVETSTIKRKPQKRKRAKPKLQYPWQIDPSNSTSHNSNEQNSDVHPKVPKQRQLDFRSFGPSHHSTPQAVASHHSTPQTVTSFYDSTHGAKCTVQSTKTHKVPSRVTSEGPGNTERDKASRPNITSKIDMNSTEINHLFSSSAAPAKTINTVIPDKRPLSTNDVKRLLVSVPPIKRNRMDRNAGNSSSGAWNFPVGVPESSAYAAVNHGVCPFCSLPQANVTRHVVLEHNEEVEVISALQLPPEKSMQAFSKMRNQGMRQALELQALNAPRRRRAGEGSTTVRNSDKCPACLRWFCTLQELFTHIKVQHKCDPYYCTPCKAAFCDLNSWVQHSTQFHQNYHQQHTCKTCQANFCTLPDLVNHLKFSHIRD